MIFQKDLSKTNIEVSFKKKIHDNPKGSILILMNIFQKNILSEECKALFLVSFNIIISYIFPENFIQIHQVSQKILVFTYSLLTIFVSFWKVSVHMIISPVFLTWNYFA